MTPRSRTAGSRSARLFSAPRALNAPTSCRFSALSQSSAPASSSSAAHLTTGVRTTWPFSRPAAASTSSRLGPCTPSLPLLLHLLLQLLQIDAGRQPLRHPLAALRRRRLVLVLLDQLRRAQLGELAQGQRMHQRRMRAAAHLDEA